jgi:high affinity sulfate transporter 1
MVDRIPGLALARSYRRQDLARDLVAGVVLATMLVPQGMAYAELTGLPAETGLYTTVAALIGYAVFGPNRVLVLGPDSSLAPIIAAVVLPLAAGDSARAVALAAALSLITGLICVLAGYAHLGTITELFSKPVRIGYLNGIAAVVLISQIPKALGFSIEADSTLDSLAVTWEGIAAGQTVTAALMTSALSLVVIFLARRIWPGAPGVLAAVILSLLAVAVFDLTGVVDTVGGLPAGLPRIELPGVVMADLGPLLVGALAVAVVSFADTGALSTATSIKAGTRSDPNAEAKALGAANLLSGLVQGFPSSASSSRTAVALSVGSRTQLTGLVAAAAVAALLVWSPNLLSNLPSATLAAIVISAAILLFDWEAVRWLWRVRRSEFLLSLGAFLGVVLIGVLEGLLIAVLLSLGNFIRRAWHPHSAELVRVPGLKGYHDRERHPEGRVIPGLLLLRFDAPLFFANAPTFARRLEENLEIADRPLSRVIVVGDAITDIDTTGAEILTDLLENLARRGVDFGFAGLKGAIKDRLRSYGLYDRIGDQNFFPTVGSSVAAHSDAESDESG